MYFCRKGCSVLFCTERAVHISVDYYDPARAWHLGLEECVMWYRIELSECGSPEQCMIATAKGDDIEDHLFTSKIVQGSEDHLQCV